MICKTTVLLALLNFIVADWKFFKKTHGKHYGPEEDIVRREIYEKNVAKIQAHNKLFDLKKATHQLALTEFSDMTKDELKQLVMGPIDPSDIVQLGRPLKPLELEGDPPASINWVEENCVTPAKIQGNCGSCWSFAATGALESHYCISAKKLLNFSEEYILACSDAGGCNGGIFVKALQFVQKKGSIPLEKDFPYRGRKMKCIKSPRSVPLNITEIITLNDEFSLQKAVAYVGPVAVVIQVDVEHMSQLDHGPQIFFEPKCVNNDSSLKNHAVLVVGYGSDNGADFWLVKNSWGPNFRNNGFIKLPRNRGNHCQIATFAAFPVLSKQQSLFG